MSGQVVIDLSEAEDIALVGGKAASLNKLMRAGFKVPKGFVVSTASQMKMTKELQKQIKKAYQELGAELVAVRSSAVAEDGAKDAWAGQFETFLNVSKEQLIAKIEDVWASTNSPRAKAYAKEKNINSGGIAVIVQAMVQSQAAGVGFSINPITNNAKQIVIEAGLGLGEAVVSGEITPDTYIVSKATLQIAEKRIGHQARILTKEGWQELGGKGSEQKITDEQIVELAKMINKLESYYGFPVDTEWVLVNDEFIPNQSRPITTLQ